VLLVILKVREGAGGSYWWVQCGTCDAGWQVPHYAAGSVGDNDPLPRRGHSKGRGSFGTGSASCGWQQTFVTVL
jgi:hypothetical protein